MEQKPVLDVNEVPKPGKWLFLSIQHLFAMFGSTVLVPFLTGLNPSVALISSGLGTLAFLLITKGQVPAYLGSSFAFIAPIITAKTAGGPGAAMLGGLLAGLVYILISFSYYSQRTSSQQKFALSFCSLFHSQNLLHLLGFLKFLLPIIHSSLTNGSSSSLIFLIFMLPLLNFYNNLCIKIP